MKRTFLIISLFSLIFTSACLKRDEGCRDKTIASESATITSYAATKGIAGTTHSSGIYYQIITPGSGATPTANSKVVVTYSGELLNGTVFDSGTSPATGWNLSGLIAGWQLGLPLIQKGGHIKLVIPSSLAYGCRGAGTIPSNSVLYFDIQLTDVL